MDIEIHEPPHPDMPAWSLMESGKERRTKVFQFNRIVTYVESFVEPVSKAFVIPGGIRKSNGHYESLHTVGELRDIAEQYKLTTAWHEELGDPLNMPQLYHNEMERRQSLRKGRKVYGRNTPRS